MKEENQDGSGKPSAEASPQEETPAEWAYRVGLKLDRWISLYGMDNFQRIEAAIAEWVKWKKSALEGREAAGEGASPEPS